MVCPPSGHGDWPAEAHIRHLFGQAVPPTVGDYQRLGLCPHGLMKTATEEKENTPTPCTIIE